MPPALPSPAEVTPPAAPVVGFMNKYRLDPASAEQSQSKETQRPPSDFPSPRQSYYADPEFVEQKNRVDESIHDAKKEAVRAAVRRNWQKTLMGSTWHEAFILNILLTTTSDEVISRTVKELAHLIVSGNAKNLAKHFYVSDFDEIADDLLLRCSDQFLDKALERRLLTITPRALINALAKAERLGYDSSDILDETSERVVGGIPRPPLPGPPNQNILLAQQQQQKKEREEALQRQQQQRAQQQQAAQRPQYPPYVSQTPVPTNTLRCVQCRGMFSDNASYNYHVQNRICSAQPPEGSKAKYWCPNCGYGFKTKGGLNYHELNKVCGPPKAAKPPVAPSASLPMTPGMGPVFNHYTSPAQRAPAPAPVQAPARVPAYTPTQPPVVQSTPPLPSSGNDPYAHLDPTTRAKMDEEMKEAEQKYAPRIKAAEALTDPKERRTQLTNLNNSFSTRQSGIRKKYGVRLRVRRTRAEIDAQNSRMGISTAMGTTTSAAQSEADDSGPPPAKRQRADEPVIPRVATTDISGGLGGTTATPAMTDPTRSFVSPSQTRAQQPSDNNLSSLQQKGYRISSHMGSQASPDMVMSDLQRPVSVSSSTSGESDSDDEEIPATLPIGTK